MINKSAGSQVALFLSATLYSFLVYAEPTVSSQAPALANENISAFTNWPIILLVLIGMIGFILALAWFVKRFGGMHFSGNREMKVVTSIPLGARERVALIDIKGQQFLIGVTTQQISHLHSFDEAVISLDQRVNSQGQHDFAAKLQSILNPQQANNKSKNSGQGKDKDVS